MAPPSEDSVSLSDLSESVIDTGDISSLLVSSDKKTIANILVDLVQEIRELRVVMTKYAENAAVAKTA